jgi:hypothetical protein
MVSEGRHTSCTDLECTSTRPTRKYNPAQGLITLFNKTGIGHCNPKSTTRSASPQTLMKLHRLPYAEVVQSGMEGNRKFGNGTAGSGTNDFRG